MASQPHGHWSRATFWRGVNMPSCLTSSNGISMASKSMGHPLQPGNGRDSIRDAYEEALDLTVYLQNAIQELWPGTGVAESQEHRTLTRLYHQAIGIMCALKDYQDQKVNQVQDEAEMRAFQKAREA